MLRAPIHVFPELEQIPGLGNGFVGRQAGAEVSPDRDDTLARLQPGFDTAIRHLGFDPQRFATAEQVHGGAVAVVGGAGMVRGVDGLVCDVPGVALGIVVADCCAVYLVDRERRVAGLVHSGKRGTEADIVTAAIRSMGEGFGTEASDLIVRLSPCIRPPAYEVDIAAAIKEQLARAGVRRESVFDDGVCTASDLDRFYSYRAEKGATGRMLAVLGWLR